MNKEPVRDPELEAALRRLDGDWPWSDADAERMRQGILARAAGPLARLRGPRPATWWDVAGGWARAAVPLAAAAAMALALVLPRELETDQGASVAPVVADRAGLALVVSGEIREGEAVDAILSPVEDEWLPSESSGGVEQ